MRGWLVWGAMVMALALWMAPAGAQERSIRLAADDRLEASGLLRFLLPRFSLKHRVKVEVIAAPAEALAGIAAKADAVLGARPAVRALREAGQAGAPRAAFFTEASETVNYAAAAMGDASEHTATFLDWLTSEIGQRTVATYEPETGPRYLPGALQVEIVVEVARDGDADEGEKLAHFHCGRCHVISDRNRFGGIGSTPSFPALRTLTDWEAKFSAFFSLNPHPSFTQVEGVTPPFDPMRPPHIAPVELTLEEVEAIVAYAASIPPKDLGAPISDR